MCGACSETLGRSWGLPGPGRRARAGRGGQSLIESCLVIAIICLVFFGVFQFSQLLMAKDVLGYAAGRGARAKTVGFNRFMVYKTVRVGSIANAGEMITPDVVGGPLARRDAELARVPLYLGAEDWSYLDPILDYAEWDTVRMLPPTVGPDGVLHYQVRQDYPLRFPFHRAFYADDSVPLAGEEYIGEHYSLYIDDDGL